ncbi:hypothetical protein E2562_033525, partial [Oryza meyeriana var. granulata]
MASTAYHHRSAQPQHHHFLLLFLFCTTLGAAALSFDYDFAAEPPGVAADFLFMGDSALVGDRINLTKLAVWSSGGVAHRQLVRLWDDDDAGGQAASFTAAFSFAIGRNSTNQADGMAFFVGSPRQDLPPDSPGGFLGLFSNSFYGYGSPRTVGVEFDTFRNQMWDPQGEGIDHIGIDVNNITSKNTTMLPILSLAGVMRAEIRYDAASTKMAATVRTVDGTNYSVETAVDLKAAGVPQDAAVGFSAATGNLTESHQLLSWSFHSTADGPSPAPPVVAESKKKRIKT